MTVEYATSDGRGSSRRPSRSDYTAVSGTLTFPAGTIAFRQIVVAVMDDTVDEEEEETFGLTLGNAQHASLAGGASTLQVTGTIRDDDVPEVEVSFGSASYEAMEGGTVTVVVGLNRDPERVLTISLESELRRRDGGRLLGGAAERDIGPGVRNHEFLFAATDDRVDETAKRWC